MFTYQDLDVWKRGMDLAEECYRTTAKFPGAELYGLTNQIRRAAVSIPSNIAEGHCRRTTRAYAHHISIALGSHGELETCIELCTRIGLLTQPDKARLLASSQSVGRLLNGLYRSLETRLASSSSPNL